MAENYTETTTQIHLRSRALGIFLLLKTSMMMLSSPPKFYAKTLNVLPAEPWDCANSKKVAGPVGTFDQKDRYHQLV